MQQNITLLILTQKQKKIINATDIDDVFESIYTTLISNIQKYLGKAAKNPARSWVIDLVVSHTINILRFNRLPGSSYIKLSIDLYYQRKGLISIQKECFKWCLVRYAHPTDHNQRKLLWRQIRF